MNAAGTPVRAVQTADYGLDAPDVVRNLIIAAAAGLLVWGSAALGLWSGDIVARVSNVTIHFTVAISALWAGIGCAFMAIWMIWYSKSGKIRGRERLLDQVPWTGADQVLDVGCGRGLMVIGAARRLTSGTATGIDIWQAEDLSGNRPEAVVENARCEGVSARVQVQTADMRQLPFPDRTFDVVVSCAAIHNLYSAADRAKAISEIARVLKPGGRAPIDDIRHSREYVAVFAQGGCSVVRRLGSRLAGALLLALAAVPGQAQSPQAPARDSSSQTGTGVIRGRVTDAGGQPVRKARVRVSSDEIKITRAAMTDASGRYEVKALPAGRYSVAGTKLGYLVTPYGRTRPNGPPKPVDVTDGELVDNIDFGMWRGGVVTGRVVDEFGEPAAGAQVSLMRYVYAQGSRRLVNTGGNRTANDIGEFRIFGVQPGEYYLAATLNHYGPGDASDRFEYAPTYYPGAAGAAEAQLLTIERDRMLASMNITLLPIRSTRVSGTVLDSSGRPMTAGYVSANTREGTGVWSGGKGAPVKPDGTFSISGLTPGEYVLRAAPRLSPGDGEVALLPLTIGGDDIADLHLVGVKPSKLTGRVIVDRAATGQIRPTEVHVSVTAARGDDSQLTTMGMPRTGINDDFTFELTSRAGHVLIHSAFASADWMLKAVRVNGADVTDSGFEVAADQPLGGIEVEVTNRRSEVSGVVTDMKGAPTRDAWVIVFKGSSPARFVTVSRPGLNDRFRVKLLAGAYFAVAIDRAEPGEWTDSTFLEQLRERALAFSLGEDETKTLDLKVIAAPGTRHEEQSGDGIASGSGLSLPRAVRLVASACLGDAGVCGSARTSGTSRRRDTSIRHGHHPRPRPRSRYPAAAPARVRRGLCARRLRRLRLQNRDHRRAGSIRAQGAAGRAL